MSHIHMPAAPSLNPKGWQEVEGVKLPPITWADYTDEQLEEVFQAWLAASTKPQNLAIYRALLKDRIEEMVQRGHIHDLRRDF